ncbi:hypothetical protein HETIRDRAFT_171528 [Heterobasidion irregulare TC 32-1]|uniref:Uncharacterized protein n=1 Tax=Heterobasidion irregulare (strain TC 32-1) TaxID=747525 RepID=W4K4J0_HETIT|nr:uncharacterized protein HETIRDRAFT_171528 [Heterobasidion irregulare TC 32-1]ETW79961.1 hypothetical protein HETIRDRAFT_171528 [Heterobasidion irregulare TC 32-1]
MPRSVRVRSRASEVESLSVLRKGDCLRNCINKYENGLCKGAMAAMMRRIYIEPHCTT